MTVFCVAIGGHGDVHPMLAVAQALKKRGHRVYCISDPQFRRLATSLGLEFIEFNPAKHQSPEASSRRHLETPRWISSSWIWQGFARWSLRKGWILSSMRWLYELIEQRYVPGDTVVLARGSAFGARMAQERLGVPLASLYLQPTQIRSNYDAPGLPLPAGTGPLLRLLRCCLWASIDSYVDLILAPEVNAFRSELGLAPIRRPFSGWIHSPELVICLFPDWFGPPQPDWPPNLHLAGFPLFDEAGVREVPSELETFLGAGEPPIVFTRGSQSQWGRHFFEVSIEVCRTSGRRGVLLAPSPDSVPAKLPDTVLRLAYVPLSALLPRAAAIVHHGGIGTTALALAAGIPQVVVPLFDDQTDNARRVQRLGAGLKVHFRSYRPKSAVRTLERLLRSPEVARNCRSLAARIRQPSDLSEACRLIENLAR
jgi:UDP:flavonoid glycosyltransferase YjiC (YdhE family)